MIGSSSSVLDASKRSLVSGLSATFGGKMCVGAYVAGLGAPEVGWEGGFIPTLWWGVPHPSQTLFPCCVVLVTFSVTDLSCAAEGASFSVNRRAQRCMSSWLFLVDDTPFSHLLRFMWWIKFTKVTDGAFPLRSASDT